LSEHTYWFFRHCIDVEIQLTKLQFFIDRAETTLKCFDLMNTRDNISVLYVFCTEHIICNVLHKFDSKKVEKGVHNKIWLIQSSQRLSKYKDNVEKLRQTFGNAVAEYVENIVPSKLVVGAWNETSYLEFGSSTPIQCHGWRTRISDPLTALRLWMERFVADFSGRQISASISDGACKRLVPFAKST
jgi:hypothetical protein